MARLEAQYTAAVYELDANTPSLEHATGQLAENGDAERREQPNAEPSVSLAFS